MSVCVLGSINQDIVASVEEIPRAGETVIASGVEHFPGGKGANQAVACALMGADTLMIGAVGADEAGASLSGFLRESGVDTQGVVVKAGEPTGQAFINVASSGENAIVVASGANETLSSEDIDDSWVFGRTVFLSQLETPIATIEALFSTAVAKAGMRILNAAPARPEGALLFPLLDILIVNETELADYAGLSAIPTSDDAIADAARQLFSGALHCVVVTLGAQGALLVEQTHMERISARPTRVVDTTGAGDCFCGALAASLSARITLVDALQRANIAASLSVERPGAASSMPRLDEVEATPSGT